MTGVSIEVRGAEEAAQRLRAAGDVATRPAAVWAEIGQMLVTSTQHRFEIERDPDGIAWPPSIRALASGGKTLTDTAALRNSITYELRDNGVAVGTDLIYAAIHQFGGVIQAKTDRGLVFKIGDHFVRRGQVTIPRRSFLGVDGDDEAAITEIWEDRIGTPLGEVVHAH